MSTKTNTTFTLDQFADSKSSNDISYYSMSLLEKDPNIENLSKTPGAESQLFECTEYELHLQFRQFLRLGVGSRRTIEMQEFRAMLDEIIKSRGIKRFTKEGDVNQWYQGIRIKNAMKM